MTRADELQPDDLVHGQPPRVVAEAHRAQHGLSGQCVVRWRGVAETMRLPADQHLTVLSLRSGHRAILEAAADRRLTYRPPYIGRRPHAARWRIGRHEASGTQCLALVDAGLLHDPRRTIPADWHGPVAVFTTRHGEAVLGLTELH